MKLTVLASVLALSTVASNAAFAGGAPATPVSVPATSVIFIPTIVTAVPGGPEITVETTAGTFLVVTRLAGGGFSFQLRR